MMRDPDPILSFSLLGGPLHRLGCRLGLVRGGTSTVPLGVALGVLLWTVCVGLATLDGRVGWLFSLSMVAGHVRLLVVIPLLFLCESWLDPRMRTFVGMIVRSGVVRPDDVPAVESEIGRIARWTRSWLPEAACLVAAVLGSLLAPQLPLVGATAVYDQSRPGAVFTVAGFWYWVVTLTFFRFLVARWIWRIGLWAYFLWRLTRLQLRLVPTHPDGAGGLGYLDVVHAHFTPMVVAVSALQAASYAEEISSGATAFEALYPAFALILLMDAVLFLGPLLIVTPRLWACRVRGLSDYMELAASYVTTFDKKWLGPAAAPGEPLLGTQDLQSLADLANSVDIVRRMRVSPVTGRTLRVLAVAATVPLLPLLMFKYPIAELTRRLFMTLAGQ
ncbi:MAG: hypothetical protein MUF10_06055 [Thermoanaerobaculaceae bacterium]|jgi:hypothetical protein|nr:hypothetical protein [Thermoanaerobaculaceae bacterium]